MPKQKTHKGLMKRIRITKTGKIKMNRAFGRHLRSKKSADRLRSYRKNKYAVAAEAKRLQPILPVKVRGHKESAAARAQALGVSHDEMRKDEKKAAE